MFQASEGLLYGGINCALPDTLLRRGGRSLRIFLTPSSRVTDVVVEPAFFFGQPKPTIFMAL
jgi:hypothetical protein